MNAACTVDSFFKLSASDRSSSHQGCQHIHTALTSSSSSSHTLTRTREASIINRVFERQHSHLYLMYGLCEQVTSAATARTHLYDEGINRALHQQHVSVTPPTAQRVARTSFLTSADLCLRVLVNCSRVGR